MITVKQARELLKNSVVILTKTEVEVFDALNLVLADDICSPVDLPPFDQSAMDGFAVNIQLKEDSDLYNLPVLGETKAGDSVLKSLDSQTAMAVYTGAPIPQHTTCVVVQEKVSMKGGKIEFQSDAVKPLGNIRFQGSQIKQGELALPLGTRLNPGAIGLISSFGLSKVHVYRKPVTGIIATGNELVKPGQPLKYGQIFESNSFMLKAALEDSGFKVLTPESVKDDADQLFETVIRVLNESDMLILSGGISVGKYDLVKSALEAAGVQQVFYKIAQKPGKPIYFGMHGNKPVFALPGNPASLLVCFYEYVLPVLRKMSGESELDLKHFMLPLTKEYAQKGSLDLFLKAYFDEKGVEILECQESNVLTSFASANAIVYLPGGEQTLFKDTLVEVHILP